METAPFFAVAGAKCASGVTPRHHWFEDELAPSSSSARFQGRQAVLQWIPCGWQRQHLSRSYAGEKVCAAHHPSRDGQISITHPSDALIAMCTSESPAIFGARNFLRARICQLEAGKSKMLTFAFARGERALRAEAPAREARRGERTRGLSRAASAAAWRRLPPLPRC